MPGEVPEVFLVAPLKPGRQISEGGGNPFGAATWWAKHNPYCESYQRQLDGVAVHAHKSAGQVWIESRDVYLFGV